MSKFTKTKEIITNKNGENFTIIKLKVKDEKNLITYGDVETIYNNLIEKDEKLKSMKILSSNRYRKIWTLKSADSDELMSENEYFKNKANKSFINGMYAVWFVKRS